MDTQARALGIDPFAKLCPTPDQGLMGHLDRALGCVGPLGRDQAGVAGGQGLDQLPDRVGPRGVVGQEFAVRHPPLGVLGPLPRLHQAQEEPAAEVLVHGRQVAVDLVRPMIEYPLDTPLLALVVLPQFSVRAKREPANVALLPDLGQGELEQRQGSRLPLHVGQKPFGQSRLRLAADEERRLFDRLAQLRRGHRPDQLLVGAEHCGELRERRAGAQEVGPHRQDDRHPSPRRGRRIQEIGEEAVPVLIEPDSRRAFLRPVGEDLLELVDHHDQPLVLRPIVQGYLREDVEGPCVGVEIVGQLQDLGGVGQGTGRQEPRHDPGRQVLQRVVPRPQDRDRPALAPLDRPRHQPRHQPGQHHRRLAATRRPKHAQEPHPLRRPDLAPQGADQPARQVFAAEEELRVVGSERLESAIWVEPLIPRLVRWPGLGLRDPPH